MEMTIKNKILLAMHALIEETKKHGGVPKDILLSPSEAMHFILEGGMLTPLEKKDIFAKHKDDNGFDIRFLLKSSLTKEEAINIVQRWHAGEFTLEYKNVTLKVIPKPKITPVEITRLEDMPSYQRIAAADGKCSKCGSALHRKWGFLKIDGCIEPECQNYWDNY